MASPLFFSSPALIEVANVQWPHSVGCLSCLQRSALVQCTIQRGSFIQAIAHCFLSSQKNILIILKLHVFAGGKGFLCNGIVIWYQPHIKNCTCFLDNPWSWYKIISRSTKLGEAGLVVHVQGVSRADLKQNLNYCGALLINRTVSPPAW